MVRVLGKDAQEIGMRTTGHRFSVKLTGVTVYVNDMP